MKRELRAARSLRTAHNSRVVSDKTILEKFAADFAGVVERHARYIIVSGFVAIAHGRSRGTEDIDMVIERMPKEKFVLLHADLVKSGFECIQSDNPGEIYDDYLSDRTSVRYVKKGMHLPEMEIKFAKDMLDDYQLKTRKKLPMTGMDLYFSSIEMNIAFKEQLLKSDKDVEDAKHLRIIYEGRLDEDEIEMVKRMIREMRLK
jgi:hypothetical protein